MKYGLDENSRKRLLGKVARYLHDLNAEDMNGYLPQVIAKLTGYVEERGRFPEKDEIQSILNGIKTSLFKSNHLLTKDKFASWLAETLQAEGTNVIHTKERPGISANTEAIRISIDDIDSFQKVKRISTHKVRNQVPMKLPESQIKHSIADILGEPFTSKDWSGELADLFSSHLVYQGKRLAAGFLLKGPGIKSTTLTINRLGKNGDQIVRLTSISLDLYAVQFVGTIAQAVVEHLETQVKQAAQKAGQSRYYCIIDGTDTARLLKAYEKL
jgi:hypothetical protein